jgi:cytochrome c553
MKARLVRIALAVWLGCAGLAGAQTPPAAAAACAVCHGLQGVAMAPDAPHLAGQPAMYLAAQLRAYRNGSRKHEVMGVMAKNLTDAQLEEVVQWFAGQRIKLEAAP